MSVNDSGVHIGRKAEIVGVNNELLQSEDTEMNDQEFFRVCAEILKQAVQFACRSCHRIVQSRIHQQLPDRALP